MKLRTGILRGRRAILLASTISTAVLLPSVAPAADYWAVVSKREQPPAWYFYGGFEAGARFYIEKPPSGFGRDVPPLNWQTSLTTDSIAKLEEYGKIPQAPLLDWINLQTGTKDGRYALDFWGRSVGLNNQSYSLDASAIGYQYLSVGWDQTPHLISTSAKTLFNGVGSTTLTVPSSVRSALQAQVPFANLVAPPAAVGLTGDIARTNIENIINNSVYNTELGTRRDRSSVAYKLTPNDNWTFGVDYSNEHRTGVRPLGVSWGFATGPNGVGNGALGPFASNAIETPAPIDDRTQNIDAGGEYFGTTFFGTKWNTNVRYAGSFYNNDNKYFTADNPFCITCTDAVASNKVGPNLLLMPMQPDNQANGVVWNTGINLPWFKSRYMSTFQFNHMTQDDPFISTATNGIVPAPIKTLGGVPVNSLNGVVNTVLWNNVLTAYVTNDLRLIAKYRHYDIDNNTPMLMTANYNRADSGLVTQDRISLPIAYTKDNASTDLNYRPVKWFNIGGGWAWERWDRKYRDANVTNEQMAKGYADISLTEWMLWRGSYLYGQRRYDTYDLEAFVCDPARACSDGASNLRRFDISNRNRQKGETAFEIAVIPAYLTVTPTAGLRWDDYPDPVFNPLGVRSDHAWNTGVEIAALIQPTIRITAAYTYEDGRLFMTGGSGGANFISGNVLTGCPTDTVVANPENIIGNRCTWSSDIHQRSHTFLGAADWKVVPNKFDLRFEYLYVRSTEANLTAPCTAPLFVGATAVGTSCDGLATTGTPATLVNPALVNFGQFPEETNTFQRVSVIGRYYVDPVFVRQMGWIGDVTLKIRYTLERNHNSNWAYDTLTPYVPTPDTTELSGANRSLFLAAFNPNYKAQLIAATAAVKW